MILFNALSVAFCLCLNVDAKSLIFLRIFEDQQIGMLLRRFYAVWQVLAGHSTDQHYGAHAGVCRPETGRGKGR